MDLKEYRKKGLIRSNERERGKAEGYLGKARNNLLAMQIDYKITEDEHVKKLLNLSGFKQYDWVVVKGYYAMYMACLACLAKLGFKSENHGATISALEFYFVKKGKLEEEYLRLIESASLEQEYVENLRGAKNDRINAQYDISEQFEKRKAEEIIEIAKKFVDRLEKLFYEIK